MLIAQAFVTGILNAGIYALVATGLTLIFGVINVVNFAHGAILMLAMYESYWLYQLLGVSPYLSVLVNLPVFFLVGYLLQRYLIQPTVESPHYVQLLLTMGVMLVFENVAMMLWGPNPRVVTVSLPAAVKLAGVVVQVPRLVAFTVALAVSGGLYFFLGRTDVGRAIRCCAQDRVRASLLGIEVKRLYCLAFGIGTACVGVAGALVVPFMYAYPYIGETFLLTSFIIVQIGGFGNFLGALLGALIVGVIQAIGAVLLPGTTYMVLPLVALVLVLLLRPSGLLGVS